MQNLEIEEIIQVAIIVSDHVSSGADLNIDKLQRYYKKVSKNIRYNGTAYRIIFLNDLTNLKMSVESNRSWTKDLKSAINFLNERRKDGFRQTALIYKAKIKGINVNELTDHCEFVEDIMRFSCENEIIALSLIPGSFKLVKEIVD